MKIKAWNLARKVSHTQFFLAKHWLSFLVPTVSSENHHPKLYQLVQLALVTFLGIHEMKNPEGKQLKYCQTMSLTYQDFLK